MRKGFVLLTVMTFVMVWACLASADWVPGDPYKMHYPQLPDTTSTGWDVLSSGVCATTLCRVADDFECTSTGWVKDIHFWGSWKNDLVAPISYFHFEIFNDAGGQPGQRIWWYDALIADVQVVTKTTGIPVEGWWDACGGSHLAANHTFYYQYNVNIAQNRYFCQEVGHVYWLSIYACLTDPLAQWGWKTSISQHYGADGMYGYTGSPWMGHLVDPVSVQSRDLAFVITGDDIPPQKVPSLSEWGVIILAMLIAAAGVVAVLRRRAALRAC